MVTEEQIRELAYSIWEQEGQPNGKDWEHYYKAKLMLEEREATASRTGEPQLISPPPAQAALPSRTRRMGRKR